MIRRLGLFSIHTSRQYQICQRLFSTKSTKNSKLEIKFPRKRSLTIKEKEVYQYFSSPEKRVAHNYPESFFVKKRGKTPDNFYVANNRAASIIANHLKQNLPADKLIMEINPGIGLLTQKLIDETENDLFLYEAHEELFDKLAIILHKHQHKKISLKQCDFIGLWKMGYLDKLDDGNRVELLFDNIQRKEFDDDTCARLFSCIGTARFFKDFINSVIFQIGFAAVGRFEMFLCVPPPIFLQLTASPEAGYFLYRPTSVLFQILFEYEFLEKIDRKHFLPWRAMPSNTPKVGKVALTDFDYMYLIRLTPRKDLFKYCLPQNLPALWFYIKQHMSSRKKQVIPTLERWIPGCGPRLIVNAKPTKKPEILYPNSNNNNLPPYIAPSTSLTVNDFVDNINIFTQFGNLTPTQILTSFNEFINWPEYESCAFVDVLEKALIKMHTRPEDADDVLSDDEDDLTTKNFKEES